MVFINIRQVNLKVRSACFGVPVCSVKTNGGKKEALSAGYTRSYSTVNICLNDRFIDRINSGL